MLVSNRGPLSFQEEPDGTVTARRGAGGLVSGLGPLVAGTDATWMAAAMSDTDRKVAREGVVEAEGLRARLVEIDAETYRLAYDVVSNQALWFVHHGLYDLPRSPVFGVDFQVAWEAYQDVNRSFAKAIAQEAPADAVVLVQDYHLALVAQELGTQRDDLTLVHFSHTPFAPPVWLRVLPRQVVGDLLGGMSAFDACGFHTRRWADDFLASCQELATAPPPPVFVSPLPSDPDDVRAAAASPECDEALATLERAVGDRAVIGRVDRIELSKNIVRGFLAFGDLLERYPDWHRRVVFVASIYPSRGGVADYRRYQEEVLATVKQINDRWSTPDWTPVVCDTGDHYPTSLALLRRADVLLVNPLRDGLNLVAKEGALVNGRDAVLCLSPEAGVWAELGDVALPVNPFDIAGTADVLARALDLPPEARREHATRLRALAEQRRPADWLADQLAAADGAKAHQ
jgi:trehalose 6-phosphate synthase